ncbi:MAG TPA: ATP-binding protein [Steroidobacteraceae bacterium]|nr:ATP-binding protein [Steroidobacteraceae bacterium]
MTTGLAIIVASILLLTRDLTVYRQSWAADLANQASIISYATGPAMAFDDYAAATRYLSALKGRPRVLQAALYSANGSLYASYVKEGESPAPAHLPAIEGTQIQGARIELVQPVVSNTDTVGTLYLRAQYDQIGRVKAYVGILALVMALSMLVAYAFSRSLQSVITQPLDAMSLAAREIVDRGDYSLRVRKFTDDEFGITADAFNKMLEEVQSRARAQEDTNRALREEVETRQTAEAALKVATARLESTMAAAEIGTWTWDVAANNFTADRNLAVLFGLTEELDLTGNPELHRRQIHADDLPSVLAAEKEAMTTGVLAATEFRVTWPDGSEHWMARRGKVQTDGDGKAVFFSGLLIDVTAQKQAEQALRASEKLYRAIGESIDYGVWVADPGGHNVYVSESFLRLIGKTQTEWSNADWSAILQPEDAASTVAAWREFVGSNGTWYRESHVLGADRFYHPILVQGVAIKGDDGEITGYAGINLDISRLKATEEALREADRRKDEFLATLAHELRNPLTPIRHAVKLLGAATADEHKQQWARTVIERQLQRMALMLDDLLEVSRITRGRLELKKAVVTLDFLVTTAVETVRPLIDSKQQHLAIELPHGPVSLVADPLRLSQAISNLLMNAAKYTDEKGTIALQVELSPTDITITVKDDGIGLDPTAIPRLFEMFSQVESAIDRSEGGLGIGLALVKGLVQLHGGDVVASSDGVGLGSRFTIRLPIGLLASEGPPEEIQVSSDSVVAGARRRVLVADDNRDAAETLGMLLSMEGYEVSIAHGGKEAIESARVNRPLAAILDIGMPDLNGYEVARRIKEAPWGRDIFLLAITGWGQKEDIARAKKAGFDEHLTKPVHSEGVIKLLQAYLTV